ncbi:MAG: MFS transporter [Oenococcus sp.]|uniref:MFS transporter n=1 Tax=Oenococcus sp. TaxID=1979414 RepID=UPI0039EBE74C
MLGAALNPINDTLISTALVPIAHSFHIAVAQTVLLVSAPYLACAVAQPTAGKLSEQIGPRKTFLSGVIMVLLGGILGGLSQNLISLIISRVIIGIGTSAGYPSAMFMVRARAKKAGMINAPGGVLAALAVVGLTFIAVGPPIGGVLVASLGWRMIFFINIPFALLTILFIFIGLEPDEPLGHQSIKNLLMRIDIIGILGFAVMISALLLFLISIPSPEWISFIVFLIAGFLFVIWELHTQTPFFDIEELLSNTQLMLTYLRTMIAMLGAYIILYSLPQWLEDAHAYPADTAGLMIVPMGIVSAIVSTLISRKGLVLGSFIATGTSTVAGGILLTLLGGNNTLYLSLIVTAVFGITLGAAMGGGQLALFKQANPQRVGTASGLLRTFTYLGSISASSVTGIAFHQAVSDPGLHAIGLVVAILGVVILLITLANHSSHEKVRS